MTTEYSNRKWINSILTAESTNLDTKWLDIDDLTDKICLETRSNMSEYEIWDLIAKSCISRTSRHPHFDVLASRFLLKCLYSTTESSIVKAAEKLFNNIDKNNIKCPIISPKIYSILIDNQLEIESKIDQKRDQYLDYFGLRTLERAYLLKIKFEKTEKGIVQVNKIVERPQYMFMRVALGIHGRNLKKTFETYDLMSNKYFTHATPTLFNAGTPRPQMSSCFLLSSGDSITKIFKTVNQMAEISKWAGGIGIALQDIRCKGSMIRGTNGESDGIIPLCKLLDSLSKYVNQGGKRNGSFAVYLEPWHADIFEFCEMRRNTKSETNKARDLFSALWIPDLFMKRVLNDEMWTLMCPDECPNLSSTYGEEFEKLYTKYEKMGIYRKQIKAKELWSHILLCQTETGMPYVLYKDNVNKKSNQSHLGTIKCSNLCTEIMEYTDENTIAVCNLASICLPQFIENKDGKNVFNYEKLRQVAELITENLNNIIDENYYPVPEAKESNEKYRPIGIGVQGLADTFNIFGYPFDSEDARELNKKIFETIYFGCLTKSNQLAEVYGPFSTFEKSKSAKGILQFHMWDKEVLDLSTKYDWTKLIENIKKYGLRNSLLTTVMPTASTAQIMGFSEAIEPYTANVYTRNTLAGQFTVINRHLVYDLIKLNLWSKSMHSKILFNNGSIQNIKEIPDNIKKIYKTAYEIPQKILIDLSIDRAIYIDQSQSLNLFQKESDFNKLGSALFHGWKNGLKTGMYYLRNCPAVTPLQYGIDKVQYGIDKDESTEKAESMVCTKRKGDNYVQCDVCS